MCLCCNHTKINSFKVIAIIRLKAFKRHVTMCHKIITLHFLFYLLWEICTLFFRQTRLWVDWDFLNSSGKSTNWLFQITWRQLVLKWNQLQRKCCHVFTQNLSVNAFKCVTGFRRFSKKGLLINVMVLLNTRYSL